MTKLSPAAQAVLDAFESTKFADRYALAAALRAAADELKMPDDLGLYSNAFWAGYTSAATKLLAIAAELDPSP
jgi:urease accessory protein UreF